MRPADAEAVSELLHASYRWLGKRERLTPEQTDFLLLQRGSLELVRRESKSQLYMVARDGDRIVGVVAVHGEAITKLYVGPERMGRGVGSRLYKAAESAIRSEGESLVKLISFPSAVPFYERMGLKVVDYRKPTGTFAGLRMAMMEKRLGRRTLPL